jgi:hypothetical protein
MDTKLEALRSVKTRDSVHFLDKDYDHLVNSILKSANLAKYSSERIMASGKMHFWRGFQSPVGAATAPGNTAATGRSHGGYRGHPRGYRGRERYHPFHPLELCFLFFL